MAIITISRQAGSGGDELAVELASILAFRLITREQLERGVYDYCLLNTIRQLPLPEIIPPSLDRPGARLAHRNLLRAVLLNLASNQHLILLGYGGQIIFRDFANAINVRVVASFDHRVKTQMREQGMGRSDAAVMIKKKDAERKRFLKEFYGVEIGRQLSYDMVLNLNRLSVVEGARIVAAAFSEVIPQANLESFDEFRKYMELHHLEKITLNLDSGGGAAVKPRPSFAHESEEEFVRVLDFYNIAWEYEPKSFPIQWDSSGEVIESFTPDFFLPEFGSYIELTTMKQDLVTKKNRKIRRLRELYPEVNLKVFYGRDYKKILGKYGLE